MDSVRQRFIGGAPAKTESPFGEPSLKSVTQMRMFGDGRWQYRDGISGLHGSKRIWDEWRDC